MSSPSFDSGRELDAQDIVTLTDAMGRSLDCYVENEITQDGTEYYFLMPVDQPVVILAWDEDEADESDLPETELVEDPEELAEIFPDAKAVLAEHDLILQDTAHVMTVRGELPPLEEDKILSLEIEDDDFEDEELEAEELQELARFYHLDQLYSIYTPLEPIPIFVKVTEDEEMEILEPGDPMIQSLVDTLLLQDAD
ncbi:MULTISPECIES: DUF3727 domain-containing protein [Cyanophyceae]|uniref:DUF3727 domain-containing protein n=1 Tax=Cyanophyceae TaxID=3028117 RepID=UPI0002ED3EF1|nr:MULTISPECIES: DUF3727 domain-containing protein [Cyanophyceae]SMH56640.1 Protein of unknown function [Picosynechococcus sp. OG1]SMQ83474.1 Protein of unknown function [Synechococcus sp. 7002]